MGDVEQKIKIMAVDDEMIITMHLEELLTKFGYDVVGVTSNGEKAVEMAKKLKPDLILMDIIMPGTKSGIEAATEIRNELGIPIIFLTAFGDDSIIEKTKDSEPFGYLLKPFKSQALRATIEVAVNKLRKEIKLKESEEKYRTVVEESRDGIGIVQDGVFKYVNPTLFFMLGRPDGLEQTPITDYFLDTYKERFNDIMGIMTKSGEIPPINELVITRKDGSVLPVEISGAKILFDGNDAIQYFFHSIAERKYVEGLLDHQVHEINENNQIVISNIEKYLESNKNIEQKEQLNQILSNLFQNANAIKKVYKLLQLEQDSTKFYPVNIMEKINDVAILIKHQYPQKNININTSMKGTIPNTMADDFIEDVFHLMFENSINNTKSKNVEIRVIITSGDIDDQKFVKVRLEDKGKHISEREKNIIFDQLNKKNYQKGLGIELSMVKLIIQRYLGEINIQSNITDDPSKGNIYTIKLPAMNFQ
jgi:PAS domain S-box-containing protein